MPVRWALPGDSDEEDEGGVEISRQYEQTLMYGRYKRDLGDYAKKQAQSFRRPSDALPADIPEIEIDKGKRNVLSSLCRALWEFIVSKVGEDWLFLALLGFLMATVSFLVDFTIARCNQARILLYRDLAQSNPFLQYLSWVCLPVCLIIFSAGFVHLTAPQAVGSGIPEMKTILRGVVLKEYLTFKTLIAKVIGLTATLGTGLPLGKEGPFVHIASIVATLLSKAITSFKGIFENESRNSEMLAAACAVGVACSFAAPIGGVLFSIEVTSVYFAVRNYWRGFFAAVCGSMMFRLLAVWFNDEETLTALFRTSFTKDFPFDPLEMFVFALIGVTCGFLGAFFVYVHRRYVTFMRRNKKMKAFLQKSRLFYPFLVTLVYSTLNFPLLFGQFVGGILTTHDQVVELFSNVTWTKENPSVIEYKIIDNWTTPWTGIFVNLFAYIIFTFGGSVLASTLPVPSGIFIPVFKIGAALGRIIGELMALTFPTGFRYGGITHSIIPGGYSIVGAAAMAGAVTHTISTSVIVFELTGQITHILPVMIAVLIANAISQVLQPSIYDSIIRIKKLPYLPDILTSTSKVYDIYVEDFMIRDVKYIWYGITYRELKDILVQHKKIRILPIVDSPQSMVLLGSIKRSELITSIDLHLGRERKKVVTNRWKLAADKALATEYDQRSNKLGRDSFKSFSSLCKQLFPLSFEKESGFRFSKQNLLSKIKSEPTISANRTKSLDNCRTSGEDRSSEADEKSKLTLPLLSKSSDDRPTTEDEESEVDGKPSNDSPEEPLESLPTDESLESRRPSRFAVTKVESPSKTESTVTLQIDPVEIMSDTSPTSDKTSPTSINMESMPRKSILKKTQSFILRPTARTPVTPLAPTPYATVHSGDTSRFRQAVEAIIRKRSTSKPELKNSELHLAKDESPVVETTPRERLQKIFQRQDQWEEEEINKPVDFTECQVDPAPFQLVERTTLLKVHSLFSMLGLNHAYVTAIGRLIGVVALKELRKVIEETNQGEFTKPDLMTRNGSFQKDLNLSHNSSPVPPSVEGSS